MLMARANPPEHLTFANLPRNPSRQADLEEEVPLRRQRWLRLLQCDIWLGYARPDLLSRTHDKQ